MGQEEALWGPASREGCGPFSRLPVELSWRAMGLWVGVTRRHRTAVALGVRHGG